MSEFFERARETGRMPQVGDKVHLDLQKYLREKTEEHTRKIDDMIADAIREAPAPDPLHTDHFVVNSTWDVPKGDPLRDLLNANRIIHGEQPYAGSAQPGEGGVYKITDLP